MLAVISLNPCFNGRYSQSYEEYFRISKPEVLILVLMEDTLRAKRRVFKTAWVVLILVLMEDTLRVFNKSAVEVNEKCVLILVLMEDTLRV